MPQVAVKSTVGRDPDRLLDLPRSPHARHTSHAHPVPLSWPPGVPIRPPKKTARFYDPFSRRSHRPKKRTAIAPVPPPGGGVTRGGAVVVAPEGRRGPLRDFGDPRGGLAAPLVRQPTSIVRRGRRPASRPSAHVLNGLQPPIRAPRPSIVAAEPRRFPRRHSQIQPCTSSSARSCWRSPSAPRRKKGGKKSITLATTILEHMSWNSTDNRKVALLGWK